MVGDAGAIMEHIGVGVIGVVDSERLLGIVTGRHLVRRRRRARDLPADARVESIMSALVVSIERPTRPSSPDRSPPMSSFAHHNGPLLATRRLTEQGTYRALCVVM